MNVVQEAYDLEEEPRRLSGTTRVPALRTPSNAVIDPLKLHLMEAKVEVQADIGDKISAIKFLADSQGPWKAFLEQIENSIDEYPEGYVTERKIEVILSTRGKGSSITIKDFGRGFIPNEYGVPDLIGAVTRVADSIKRKFKDYEDAQGEFAVGLFGFRTIGKELTILTKTDYAGYPHRCRELGLPQRGTSPTYMMRMDSDTLRATIHRSEIERERPGTTIAIRHLLNRRLWTGAKVKKAVEEELWARLLGKGLRLVINDNGTLHEVAPKEMPLSGTRYPRDAIDTHGYGPIHLNLYLTDEEEPQSTIHVLRGKSHGAGATRVYRDLREMDEFNRPPWNLGRVKGWIRFDGASLSGPTRDQFIHDDAYHAFVSALKSIEPELLSMLQARDAERESLQMKWVLKDLKRDIERVCKDLPHLDVFRMARSQPPALFISGDVVRRLGRPQKARYRGRKIGIKKSSGKGGGKRAVGLPLPRFIVDASGWRSRYDREQHVILINKAHPDYERESITRKRWYRYILKLYTKELVLQCYHGTRSEARLLEATVEAQLRAEEDL